MTDEHPDFLWRSPEPKSSYEVVIVGGGGHGLATAYYLAREHGITDVAVLERGWLAGGNITRNTTVIRSNYLWDESAAIYEHSLQALGGARGGARLRPAVQPARRPQPRAHAPGRPRERRAACKANRLNGIDAEWLEPDEVAEICPILNVSPDVRYPVLGATLPAARRDRPPRERRLGLRPRRRRARRRPDPGVRGDRDRGARAAAPSRSRPRAAGSPPGGSRSSRPATAPCSRDGRPAAAGPDPSAPGARVGALRAGARHGRDVERRPRLRQPGAQGRARDGRRDRLATTPTRSAARST